MKNQVVETDAAMAHQEIERLAKERAVAEVRTVETISQGQAVRQGDVYIHRVADEFPHGGKAKSRQLAVGNTMGSRHVAEGPVEVYEGAIPPVWCREWTFLGPCLVAQGRFTVTHPEHAHVSLPAGTYQVTHQMDARTGARVCD